ncbi:cuticle protein 6.4-like isoform X1 [Schistocerca nitens]|uniref:cuticle protein 6.4-like isoform X1 n=1 Tax=Schistocerca nitens TaxID=7011 RepID=UPI002117B197|nr:cuticle protein 6.4-like isoform X1 [Schistocerca nitens]
MRHRTALPTPVAALCTTPIMFKSLVLALCLFAAVFAAEESAPKEKRGLAYATGLGYSAPLAYSSGLYSGYGYGYGYPGYAGYYGLGYRGLGYSGLGYHGLGYHGYHY